MFILTYFILISLTQFIVNKILGISDENELSYNFNFRDSIIVIALGVIGIVLQFIDFGKIFWIVVGAYALVIILAQIIFATIKQAVVQKQTEEIQQIFEILKPALPANMDLEDLDINNPPFKLGYEKHKINRITIEINPNTFKETVAVNLCLSLNKFLNDYEWVNEFDFASRECSFVGTPLPPGVAKYKGSWLRPTEFIPIGLSGLGEVSWTINSIKEEGRSNYVYEDGKLANTVDSPSAPQALVVGSPLGLNTIIPTTNGYKTMKTIETGDYVFGLDNIPVEVIKIEDINTNPSNVYELVFRSNDTIIKVISDGIHRFPVRQRDRLNEEDKDFFKPIICNELNCNDIIIGNNQNLILISKNKVKCQPVRCITVNSDEHIFLITDTKIEKWQGGNQYPYSALYTYNTGGGKAICLNQEIEVLDK